MSLFKDSRLEYRKFRVRGNIRSFRDLEIYQQTTQLSSQIFQITLPPNLPQKKLFEEELSILRQLSKLVPKLIAESYGDKFTNRAGSYQKLEKAMQIATNIITKLDFLVASVQNLNPETKDVFLRLISRYQTQKRKILNLKRAWEKVEEKFSQPQDR